MLDLFKKIQDDLVLLDRKALAALVYAAAGLTGIHYLKDPAYVADWTKNTSLEAFGDWLAHSPDNNLPGLAWWVVVNMTFYVGFPLLVVRFWQKRPLAEIGLNFEIEEGFGKLLLQCIAIMLPLVWLMSMTSGFEAKYPFLHIYNSEPYLGRTLLIWEIIYFFQFFGLEFFFRGFLLHSLKPSLGFYSIFVMTVPYCMIHFGKPIPETFAAIFAGIFLGYLSYKNGSIWLGLVLHCTVAFSMDIMALWNKGLLFR